MDIKVFLNEIKNKYPKIIEFEENDDEWMQLGCEYLKANYFDKAEEYFNKLCLSQPKHFDGFEGTAYIEYLKGNKEKSKIFMEAAIERAKSFLKDNSIDIEVIEEMEKKYNKIVNNEELKGFWT